jgi:uncharacterized phiE125 gp8 family phage protein
MATGDLVTLTTAQSWLKITTMTDSAILSALITDASSFIANTLQRASIAQASYTEFYTGNGRDGQILRNDPIQSVTSIKWAGTTITTAGDPIAGVNGFWIDGKRVRLVGYAFPYGAPVQIAYSAGYLTVPQDIQQACLELVDEAYRRREHTGEASHSSGGATTVSFDMRDMHARIKTRLMNYLRVAPI